MVEVQSGQQTIKKELQELKKILRAVIPTAKGEEERENIETSVERVEAVLKGVEKCLSDLLTEKSVKEGPERDTTCDQISGALRDLQENLKMIYEDWRKFAGTSLEPENTAWNEKTEGRLSARRGKDGMAEQSQKDTQQTCGEKRKCEEATTAFLYEGRFKLN